MQITDYCVSLQNNSDVGTSTVFFLELSLFYVFSCNGAKRHLPFLTRQPPALPLVLRYLSDVGDDDEEQRFKFILFG